MIVSRIKIFVGQACILHIELGKETGLSKNELYKSVPGKEITKLKHNKHKMVNVEYSWIKVHFFVVK